MNDYFFTWGIIDMQNLHINYVVQKKQFTLSAAGMILWSNFSALNTTQTWKQVKKEREREMLHRANIIISGPSSGLDRHDICID